MTIQPCTAQGTPTHWVVFRLGHLGDVVLTTGVLAYLAATKNWTFTIVTKVPWGDVFTHMPCVHRVISLPTKNMSFREQLAAFRDIARKHAQCGFLDLHGNLRSRLLASLWQGPVHRYPKKSISRRIFLASKGCFAATALQKYSVAERYAMAVMREPPSRSELQPVLSLTDEERFTAQEKTASLYGKNVHPVALHPFAANIYKTWPEAHWRELIRLLGTKNIPWLLLGKGKQLIPSSPYDSINKTSLRETSALLASCCALVTGDSGPMHLAVAMQTPVIALFGPTTREWGFYPTGSNDVVLEQPLPCRPCSLHGTTPCPRNGECLASILPEKILSELEQHGWTG